MEGFEILTKELKSTSALKENETIIEGLYPISMRGHFFFCLLTNFHLIFSRRELYRKYYTSELIPLSQIKAISLTRFRDRHSLIHYGILLLLGLVLIFQALVIQSFDLTMNGFNVTDWVAILLWICFFAIVIRFSITAYRVFKSENIIQLETPYEILKLQGYYRFFKMEPIFLFKGFENALNLECNIKIIEVLYDILLTHIKKNENK